jgi:hypothetical protein
VFFDLAPFRVNETMAQSGGGFFDKFKSNKVAPPSNVPPFTATNPATNPAATPATNPATNPATPTAQTDSSLLLEDSKMTNAFIVGLKTAIMVDKYTYPITDAAFKPPILYKPLTVNGVPPQQQYNYLYQLPADIGKSGSMFTLFFGKNPPPPAPPRSLDANGEPILTADDQKNLDDHHNLVSADHIAAANTAVVAINAAAPVAAPAVAAAVAPPPVASQGGRRTRRTSLPKTRKHRKVNKCNEGNKGRRVSRRKHRKSHTKRH